MLTLLLGMMPSVRWQVASSASLAPVIPDVKGTVDR